VTPEDTTRADAIRYALTVFEPLPETLKDAVKALDALLASLAAERERADTAERERDKWRQSSLIDTAAIPQEDIDRAAELARSRGWGSAEARADTLAKALRGLLQDDDLPWPPDGETCACSMCMRIKEAHAALAAADTTPPQEKDA
jgi:multidrug resistance efflux pump